MVKTTPEQNAEIARRYIGGESSDKLGPEYGVSDVTIRNILERMGIPRRQVDAHSKLIDTDDVVSEYRRGKSTIAIGKKYGVSHECINNILTRRGEPMRSRIEATKLLRKYKTCVVCGNEFWSSYPKKTCCDECRHINASNAAKGRNLKHGGSQARYQRIAREMKKQVCEECGTTDVRLDVHHIDHNKCNNNAENLKMLCVHCHARFHYFNGDVNIRGAPRKCDA
jgi:Mor family transcriptional regulator/predicted nucleic acid-binding Zn ribbon protein